MHHLTILPDTGPGRQPAVIQANVLLMMYRFYSWLAGKPLPLTGHSKKLRRKLNEGSEERRKEMKEKNEEKTYEMKI